MAAIKRVDRDTRAPARQPRVFKKKMQLKHNNLNQPITKKKTIQKKELLVTQEIKLARHLAGNDKKVRDKVLKYLKKWLTARENSSFPFTETDFLRLWKGLFYCMWMSDKPLVQEELAEALSKLVHCFNTRDVVFLYTRCALKTLATEWFGIDRYRLDKFSMLVRRIMRQTFQICKDKSNWCMDWVQDLSSVIRELLLCPKTCMGFSMHITELFLEELAKVSTGNIPKEIVTELIKPYIALLVSLDDERQIKHIIQHIFKYLIFQSDTGIEYTEKFNAWRQAGFPTGHIDAIQLIEVPSEVADSRDIEENKVGTNQGKEEAIKEKPMDPRAGRVDVELPQIPFDPQAIANVLVKHKSDSSAKAKSRRQILHLIKLFTELSKGNMPLGIKEITVPDKKRGRNNTKAAALRLLDLEEDLHSDNPPNKRKRKRSKRLLDEDVSSLNNLDEYSSDESGNENMEDVIGSEINDLDDSKSFSQHFGNNLDEAEFTVSSDEEKALSKKKKVNARKNKGKNFEGANKKCLHDTTLVNIKKNKENKKSKMSVFCETNVENTDDKRSLANGNHKEANEKKMQPAFTVTSLTKSTESVNKRNKLEKGNICGSWDVSENFNSTTPTVVVNNVFASEIVENISHKTHPEVVSTNKTSCQNTRLLPVLQNLNNKKLMRLKNIKQQEELDTEQALKKRVKIVLHRNTAQHTSEYIQKVRQSPGIPFDAAKKPSAGVLKASPIPSPINPFYKRNMK